MRAQSAIDHKGLLREAKSREGADLKSFQEKVGLILFRFLHF